MAQISTGASAAGKANVDSGFNLNVTLPTSDALTGKVRMMSENDAGEVLGVATLKSPETSPDYRLRVGLDTELFKDQFNATAQNTNLWAYTFSTLSAAQPGAGTVNFSTVQGTTAAHGAFMRTFQYFPLVNTAPLALEFFFGQFTAGLVAGEEWLMGLGLPGAAVTRPTDGVWFKLTPSGLVGVLAFNGTETDTAVLVPAASIPLASIDKYVIVIGESGVEYWRKDQLLGVQLIPTANATAFIGAALPMFMQKFNTGAVSNTNQMRVGRVGVTLLDVQAGKELPLIQAGQGSHASVGQNGSVMGSTAGGFNQTALAAATTGTNTTANVTGLGGLGVMTAQASNVAAAGDMIATSFQNPAPTINRSGRNLYITGIRVSCMNTGAAVATTPTSLIWGIAYGHTAVSLATAESASFATATAHAPRRLPLGMCTAAVGAADGTAYDGELEYSFQSPIVIRPGEFISTTVRFRVGTATALQTLTYTVGFGGFWE